MQLACLTSSQGPEHQQVVYDVGHAQDHSLLNTGINAGLQKHISKPVVAGDYITPETNSPKDCESWKEKLGLRAG